MDIAVIGSSNKKYEKRVPIHPNHLDQIPTELRKHLFFEKGYGLPFGVNDQILNLATGNTPQDRDTLMANAKSILITKPVLEDFEAMKPGTTVWGWLHSVQQNEIAQIAIDKNLTLIAWENMYYQGSRELLHIFRRNNEMAGYCGVQHALELKGIDGNFGPSKKVAVISFGSVSRGAILSLKAHGFTDITVYTMRPSSLLGHLISDVNYRQIATNDQGLLELVNINGENTPFIDQLTLADVIVNGVLQDANHPIMYINDCDIEKFQKSCLIIDISCSTGMGFSFAHSTEFFEPLFEIGHLQYYAIDHIPTLLWDSASWEISSAILPYLPYVINDVRNKVIDEAVDVKNGKIRNRDILSYQNRSSVYPYEQL